MARASSRSLLTGILVAAFLALWQANSSPALAQSAGPPACPKGTATGPAAAQYCLPLIPGKAAGDARGLMLLYQAPSPFGISVSEDGRYVYDVNLLIRGLEPLPDRSYVVWAITPDMEKRRKLGVWDPDSATVGRVDWNRFMIVVTAEPSPEVDSWQGPILFSASSPSGKMQTMAGEEILWNNELPVGTRYCLVNDC